jgi:hypothetical protein
MTSQAKKPIGFADVLQEELGDVQRRRQKMDPGTPWLPCRRLDAAAPEEERVRRLRREALDNNLIGLALSGGGIRSATFCLGVLQGLAERGLLGRFDYLSTVSGGGYIGGWLAAWIKREGDVENVEKQLRPNHVDQAEATRWRGPPRQVLDDEPEPIRHLRAFSNYLAPRPGLFSADGWVLITVYLRNLLLNQAVLLLALLGLLFGVAFVVQLFSAAAYAEDAPRWQQTAEGQAAAAQLVQGLGGGPASLVLSALAANSSDNAGADSFPGAARNRGMWLSLAVVAGVLLVIACWNIFEEVPSPARDLKPKPPSGGSKLEADAEESKPQKALRRLHYRILLPLVGTAVLVSLLTMYHLGPLQARWDFGTACWIMGGFALFHSLFTVRPFFRDLKEKRKFPLAWLIAGVAAGAFAGLLLYTLLIVLHTSTDSTSAYVPAVIALSPPLLLAAFVLTGFVQIGIVGRLLDEEQREWWSSLSGWVLIYATGWLGLFGATIFGAWLVLWLALPAASGGPWFAPATYAFAWAASVAGGLLAARSPRSGPDENPAGWGDRLLEIATRAAPAIFLVGVYILVAILAVPLVQAGNFPRTSNEYLWQLNSSSGPAFLWRIPYLSIHNAWWATLVYLFAGGVLLLTAAWLSTSFRCKPFMPTGSSVATLGPPVVSRHNHATVPPVRP